MRLGLFTLVSVLSFVSAVGAEPSDDARIADSLSGIEAIDRGPPSRSQNHEISSGALRDAVDLHRLGANRHTETVFGDRALIEFTHDLPAAEARSIVEDHGGRVVGEVPGSLTEAIIPLERIADLEATPAVEALRFPLHVLPPVTKFAPVLRASVQGAGGVGAEVAKTNADTWHAEGHTGVGVKVGIVDFFDETIWSDAQAAGEVPVPSGTFCRFAGTPCDVWDFASPHGVAVGEIIHEMAPGAEIYIAFAWTTSDLQAAVDYFASEGVDIISRSLTSELDGAGDGTGPIAAVVDNAVSQGIFWSNSAGNNASSSGTTNGRYWRAGWSDPDADGFMNFNGEDEIFSFQCGFLNGLRWNDWDGSATDYDAYIFDTQGDINTFTPKAVSVNDQTSGFDPLELTTTELNCSPGPDVDYLAIHLFDPGNGTGGDILELMGNQTVFEYSQNPYSASGPVADSANPGMMAVGAIDPAAGTTIATYSSWGPTNDNRTKPTLSAASCVVSFAYSPSCFNGTSAAAPAVSGAAALVLGAGFASDPPGVGSYLIANATLDRGSPGVDNVYGAGELVLPPMPDADGDGVIDGDDNCPNWPNPTQTLPPWTVSVDDPDCDGFSIERENWIGTDPFVFCPDPPQVISTWPVDFDDSQTVDILDVLAFKPVFFAPVTGNERYDLSPGGDMIDILDVLATKPFVFASC